MSIVKLRPTSADDFPNRGPPMHSGASRRVAHEGLIRDGLLALPVAVGVTAVRNAGIRAAAGPGENEQPLMPFDEVSEGFEGGHPTEIMVGSQIAGA
jgi:hypothetical protein